MLVEGEKGVNFLEGVTACQPDNLHSTILQLVCSAHLLLLCLRTMALHLEVAIHMSPEPINIGVLLYEPGLYNIKLSDFVGERLSFVQQD